MLVTREVSNLKCNLGSNENWRQHSGQHGARGGGAHHANIAGLLAVDTVDSGVNN
jgi:hypothetical protein